MEKKEDLVSIVVPVYNVAPYIRETIWSVINQTYTNWELVLVDDCSADQSVDLIQNIQAERADLAIRLILQQTNQGAARTRNRGIQEASGRYLAFLDADDIWEPKKLERQLAFMWKKEAAFVCTSYEFADEAGVGKGKFARVPAVLTYKRALRNTIIFTSTVLFDRMKMPDDLLYMKEVKSEDTATWWKILKTGFVVYGLDEVLVRYRRPVKSLSSNKVEAVRRIWNLYRREEKLSLPYSIYNFFFYAVRTTLRRL